MHPSINDALEDWLAYIESIHPSEIELGLQRVSAVAQKLLSKNEYKPTVFTVAGTNGKGTTTAALSALACEAGLETGWYSSPHLFEFNERIRINGKPVSNQRIVEALHAIEIGRGDISLSYFEYTTLAALWLFDQAKLKVWVLEVGLGGRLDAVNIVDADVAVITTIGIDHEAFLGSDTNVIGYEKAGICRPEKPAVLGSANLPQGLYDEVANRSAIEYRFGEQHGVKEATVFWQGGQIDAGQIRIPHDNAASACQAFYLSGIQLSTDAVQHALEGIQMPGRMQKVNWQGHEIIVDVGHNPHAGAYIAKQLGSQKVNVLLGMLADKDVHGFVQALAPVSKQMHAVSLAVPRGLSAQELVARTDYPFESTFDSMAQAIRELIQTMPDTPLFIGGSFYTVCDALTFLEK
ncbi:bifunctional tetrahydrofolate synthase/dihydrofolate synthase [Reinekea forsetii]|nr:bifunctional tetrahydrofolate synthase/dihydrofolate synthase [Reinekea forsetii]